MEQENYFSIPSACSCKNRSQFADEPVLRFLPRPRRFPQEREAGFQSGIELKTAHGNPPSHFLPAMPLHQRVDDGFQRDAVQRIARMRNRVGNWICLRRGDGLGNRFSHDATRKRRPEKILGNGKLPFGLAKRLTEENGGNREINFFSVPSVRSC